MSIINQKNVEGWLDLLHLAGQSHLGWPFAGDPRRFLPLLCRSHLNPGQEHRFAVFAIVQALHRAFDRDLGTRVEFLTGTRVEGSHGVTGFGDKFD